MVKATDPSGFAARWWRRCPTLSRIMRRDSLLTRVLLAAVAMSAMLPGAAAAAAMDPAAQSAVFLIGQSLEVRRDGRHNRLLGALRHLRDPRARPLFVFLTRSPQPAMKVHGILGLAELDPAKRVDLKLLAQIDEPAAQSQLISAAMGSDLLPAGVCHQLMAWPGLDPAVKLIVATRLAGEGELTDTAVLGEAMASQVLGRRGLAALLLHQFGDPAGTRALQELDASTDPQRDVVRAMLLQTALREGFSRCANWAHAVATEPEAPPRLALLALRVAMRFSEPHSAAVWTQRFEAAGDAADRMRLALLALRMAPWVEPAMFEALEAGESPLVRQIGATGRAVAAGEPDLAEQAVRLLLTHYPRANQWALDYARERATPQVAQLILLGVIRAYEDGPARTRVQRLDDAVEATRSLYERFPTIAAKLLRPILSDAETDPLLIQGILLGLVRCQADTGPVVAGLPPFRDMDAQGLALLLRARSGQPLDDTQVQDLALLVRGGGKLEDSLRVQAAWIYLERTGQLDAALAQLLDR